MSDHTSTQRPDWAEKIATCEFRGVKFYDILPLMADGVAFGRAMDDLINLVDEGLGQDCSAEDDADLIVGTEARGFLFGPAIANYNNLGFVPVRKPGKTPGSTSTVSYGNEYGTDTLELQKGLIKPGDCVIIIDDLIATGGTLEATAKMIEDQGGIVLEIVTLIELSKLGGRKRLEDAGYKLYSVLQY